MVNSGVQIPNEQYLSFHGRGYKIGPVKIVHGTIVMLKYMDIKTTKTHSTGQYNIYYLLDEHNT